MRTATEKSCLRLPYESELRRWFKIGYRLAEARVHITDFRLDAELESDVSEMLAAQVNLIKQGAGYVRENDSGVDSTGDNLGTVAPSRREFDRMLESQWVAIRNRCIAGKSN